MGWSKKLRRTVRASVTVKGLVNNTKNLSGIGLLQRSKTARKIALVAAVGTVGYFAAPYIVSAGKMAAAKGGGIAGYGLKKLGKFGQQMYNPAKNPQNTAVVERTGPDENLVDQLYASESQGNPDFAGRSALAGGAAMAPAACGNTLGSFSDVPEVIFTMLTISAVLWFFGRIYRGRKPGVA